MSMNETSSESDFGIRRAINKIKVPASRLVNRTRNSQPIISQDRAIQGKSLCEAQDQLKTRTAVRHDGLELWPLPGLAPMTRVRTSFGDVHAIALRKGDEVLTRSGEYKAIQWIDRIMLDEHVLNQKPDSNPIVLAPGSLGSNAPSTEIMISPRQIICADKKSGLARAREASMLVSRPGVRRLRESSLSYTMFHVGSAADVYCEGIYLQFPIDS